MVSRIALNRIALTIGLMMLIAAPAHAQMSPGVIDSVVAKFQAQAAGWQAALQSFALNTFYILALIELGWAGIRLALRNSDASEWMAEIVNQIMFLGFFLALLQNSVSWGRLIIDSFRQAARAVGGGVGVSPGDVFASGVSLGQLVLDQMSIWHPEASAALMIAGILILGCFALIAAWMVVTLVQSYIVIGAGVLFMAFGGTRWTKEIAVSTVRHTLAVGAKMMMLQLIASIGQSFITGWASSLTTMTNVDLLVIIGAALVLVAIVKIVPDEFQRLVDGSSLSSSSPLIGAAAVVGAGAAGVGLGMVGATALAGNAGRLALSQMAASDARGAEANGGEAPERSPLGRAAQFAGYTSRNMAMAPIRDIGRRLTGDIGARHGVATWRMSTDLGNRRRLLNDDQNKPQPSDPNAGNTGSSGNTIGPGNP